MNKYQEALDDLSYPDIYSPCYGDKCGETDCGDCSIKRDILTLKELVDKATPKKILRTVNDNGEPFLPRGYGECPKCKTVVGCNNKYCRECGQRLE